MTEGDKKNQSKNRVSEDERYNYIGFEVFPGKPKDLFSSQAEKQKLVESVLHRREHNEAAREQCTLLEERVTMGEKLLLAAFSVMILVALMLPWFAVYNVVATESPATTTEVTDTTLDSLAALAAGEPADSLTLAAATDLASGDTIAQPLSDVTDTAVLAAVEGVPEEGAGTDGADRRQGVYAGEGANEEIIIAHQTRRRVNKEYSRLSGFGLFGSLGSAGSYVFSSGPVLMLSGVLMLLFVLLCIGLPILNLYSLFGVKGDPDEVALKLKGYLRFNWLPLILFIVVTFLSFFGSEYGFDGKELFTSLGSSYGPGVLLGSFSWGVFVALAGSVIVAVKGIEI